MSRRTRSMAPSIRTLTSPNIPFRSLNSIGHLVGGWSLLVGSVEPQALTTNKLITDSGADRIAQDYAGDVAGLAQVEDDNRELVVHAQRDRRGVHHLELPFEDLQVGDGRVLRRLRVEHRVSRIDPVDFRPLQNDFR